MENIQIVLIVAFGFTGLFVLLLGYLIKKNQLVEIITMPDFSVENIKDKAAFSFFAAKRVYLLGWITLLTAVMVAVLPHTIMVTVVLFSLAGVLICIEFIISSKKYLHTN